MFCGEKISAESTKHIFAAHSEWELKMTHRFQKSLDKRGKVWYNNCYAVFPHPCPPDETDGLYIQKEVYHHGKADFEV